MHLRFLLLISFLVLSRICSAQDSYALDQLDKFVKVYMDQRDFSDQELSAPSFKDLFAQHDVSVDRYRQIARLRDSIGKSSLAPNEVRLQEALEAIDREVKTARSAYLKKLLVLHQLDTATYQEMQARYKSDLEFQRSLQPLFIAYINRLKE